MTYVPEQICWCGHRRSAHEHYRAGGRPTDCGFCGLLGDTACVLFTPRHRKPFNEAQRRAGYVADREMHRNLLALLPFTRPLDAADPKLPIPAQQDRRMSIADVLAARRRLHSERSRKGRAR